MRSIVVHSYKGGVGKTTVALVLAKHAALTGKRACVLDFDFIGSGMSDLFRLERPPALFLDHYFTAVDPGSIDVRELLGEYRDPELEPQGLGVALNLTERPERDTSGAREDATMQTEMLGQLAVEPRYHEIEAATRLLLDKLADIGFEVAVLDCHPGLGFVSEALRKLADVNVYVTTPNRSDCFGLLKAINVKRLDNERSFLILNMAEPPFLDLRGFRQGLERDPARGMEAEVIFSFLRLLGKDERRFAAIPESEPMRRLYFLGSSGFLPELGHAQASQSGLGFAERVLALIPRVP